MTDRSLCKNSALPPRELVTAPRGHQLDLLDSLFHVADPDPNEFAHRFYLEVALTPDCSPG